MLFVCLFAVSSEAGVDTENETTEEMNCCGFCRKLKTFVCIL